MSKQRLSLLLSSLVMAQKKDKNINNKIRSSKKKPNNLKKKDNGR